ncbi:hypothetical protein CONPUDRAFT_83885 [Coniophora puteana RWD-64-598 SS2]|uniref:TPR-like protein n=1 Tax=Coniophora puteana (strain RWD-64-598) TaxID=741705 RepID=A0A5M3MIN6_CONPW|nr:uncharacterized protein CONPUDRAFT_83885 [Coniophora puteana RWD-64-598 SS2]EIW78505.1 hypothetical protein CONPUDRAFT_83885 [Coniophora puteana RWD-64-598 SS2]
MVLGIGALTYGIYDFYAGLNATLGRIPKEIRDDVYAGAFAKTKGDLGVAERYLSRAFETALTLPPSAFGDRPYLHFCGIAASLASVQAMQGGAAARRAKRTCERTWAVLEPADSPNATATATTDGSTVIADPTSDANKIAPEWRTYAASDAERMKRVAIACMVAELVGERAAGSEEEKEEERWLTWAVEETLRVCNALDPDSTVAAAAASPVPAGQSPATEVPASLNVTMKHDPDLTALFPMSDFAAPFEALGSYYARSGNVQYAFSLYHHALALLLPSTASAPAPRIFTDVQRTPADTCNAAQILNNISELVMRQHPPSPEVRAMAEKWARSAHTVVERGLHARGKPGPLVTSGFVQYGGGGGGEEEEMDMTCESVFGVVLFNLATMREMDGDKNEARGFYTRSIEQCNAAGMDEGVFKGQEALRKLGRSSVKPDKK